HPDSTTKKPAPTVSPGRGKKKDAPAGPVDLDYETFMRGRRRRIEPTEAERNSLLGSHVSYLRAALNRWLGMTPTADPKPGADDEDEEDVSEALDTGDETRQGNRALEDGFDPQQRKRQHRSPEELQAKRHEADAEAILYAVDDYTEDLRNPDRALD